MDCLLYRLVAPRQRSVGIPSSVASAVIGVFLLVFAAAVAIRRRVSQKQLFAPSA